MNTTVLPRKLTGDELLVAAGKKRHPDLVLLQAEWERREHGSNHATVIQPNHATVIQPNHATVIPATSTVAAPTVIIEVDQNDREPIVQKELFG